MRYGFIQRLMWTGFKGTFRKQLSKSFDERNPAEVIKNASKKYRKILSGVDEFEKGDHFLMNILSCAMLSAVLLSTEKKIFPGRSPRLLPQGDVRKLSDESSRQKKQGIHGKRAGTAEIAGKRKREKHESLFLEIFR